MIKSLLIAIGGMVILMSAWGAVQFLWKKVFYDYLTDEDVLAGRSSCGNCGCQVSCKHKTGTLNEIKQA